MQIHDINFELYINRDAVADAVGRVADQIAHDYKDAEKPPVLLVTLSGAAIFAADLCRLLPKQVELAFVKCASYNQCMQSSGCVSFDVEPTMSLEGRDVIVIEDIVDTGNTWVALHGYLIDKGLNSLRIATFCIKDSVYDKPLNIDYVGFHIDDLFVVGYGMDYNQLGRNLDAIYAPSSR